MPSWVRTAAWVAGVLFLATLANYVWQNHIEDRLFPKRWGEVVPGMFRSGQLHEVLVEKTLAENGIQVVVDLRYWEEDPHMLAEQKAISTLGISSHRFSLNGDGTGNIDHYVEALVVMSESHIRSEKTLVHCAAGSQRTSGAYAFFNTLVLGQSADQVVSEMQNFGWKPGRNQVLLDYLNEHVGYVAVQLQQRGVIETVPEILPYFES